MSVRAPLSGTCTTAVSRLAPPPIEVQRFELTCRISHLGLTEATLTADGRRDDWSAQWHGRVRGRERRRDRLHLYRNAELSFTDPTDATVTFEAVQALSAGTGRFAAADGTAEVAGTTRLNLITGSGTGELTSTGRWCTEQAQ